MSLDVLQNKEQIRAARETLDARGIGAMSPAWRHLQARIWRRLRLPPPVVLGDYRKSWDLLRTIAFLEEHVDRGAPVLDIGAYASEVLVSLDQAGYTDLTGVDLNPRLGAMPRADRIRFVTSDFMATPFADASFQAVTSISVIEHGYDPERLLAEVARLLRPGGYFLASTDYWRDKIDTGDDRFFGMSWLIFSEDDLRDLLAVAARFGLRPVGEWQPATGERAISHGGYDYTFAWLALRKDD